MAITPDDSGPAGPEFTVPDDDAVPAEDVNVLTLGRQRPPAEGAWLWVTTAEGRRGGEFTALFLPRDNPCATGGDVLLHVARGSGKEAERWSEPTVLVRVRAVVAGSLIQVAAWDHLDLDAWPEIVRPAVAFAMGALKELQEHGADVGAHRHPSGLVAVESAAEAAVAGFPSLPAWVNAAGG
jgi:hypothetical protein